MKNYIYIFTILIKTFCFSQYTAVPDPNFEAFLEANGMGDGIPNNGQVLTANINSVSMLDLPFSAGISDLTGIQDFIALEFFDFSYNQVASVDMSQNLNLKIFGCAFNQLSTLDLSNNTQLEWVACMSNPGLSSISLNSKFLHTLEAFECSLNTLDLSQCPNITYLDCNINSLTSLNISQCNNLVDVRLTNNFLTSLDVSECASLEFLNLSSNLITEIDLTGNLVLKNLSVYTNNLTYLDVSQNANLTALGCSSNPNLEYIDVRNNNNENIIFFSAEDNSNLDCVFVDDANASYLEDWNIGNNTNFVENEEECKALEIITFEEKNKVKIYPNPVSEYVRVILNSTANYFLFTMDGSQLKSGVLKSGENKISLRELPSGLYFLRIHSFFNTTTSKIIKE